VPHTPPSIPSSGRLAPALRLVKAPPDSQVGTPVRIFALVLVVAALAGGLGLFVLGGPAESAAAPKVIVPYKDRKAAGATPAAATPAAATPAASAEPAGSAAPAARPAAAPAPAPAAKPKPAPKPDDGLPAKLSAALAANRTVVVALYSPDSSVAAMTRAEAEAGAKEAKVAFVALNVLRPKEIDELTATLGVISDPSVLVFRRPGKVAARLDGFADRELVAQAAASAAAAR